MDHVVASYGKIRVLNELTLQVKKGEIASLLGTNGNGKSTLLKCVTGLLGVQGGEISTTEDGNKTSLLGKTPEEVVDLGIALVPEGRGLLPGFTVQENLKMGAYRKEARRRYKENLESVYNYFPVLKGRKHQIAMTLSGGEQQMLAIAKALMSNPKILLLDEPSAGLAPIVVLSLMPLIKDLRDRYGLTIVMAEQNFVRAVEIADRGYIIVEGRVEYEGESAELKSHDLVKKFYLGQA